MCVCMSPPSLPHNIPLSLSLCVCVSLCHCTSITTSLHLLYTSLTIPPSITLSLTIPLSHIWKSFCSDYLDMENELTYLFHYHKVLKEGMVLWSCYLLEPTFDVVSILTSLHHVMKTFVSYIIYFFNTCQICCQACRELLNFILLSIGCSPQVVTFLCNFDKEYIFVALGSLVRLLCQER